MAQPIIVWAMARGPNPWKVVNVLEELGVPYEVKLLDMQGVKAKPFMDINPNGRVPAIQDPNTKLNLWESGAIIQYLIEQYDASHKISYATLAERQLCNQWLFFQTSGQGPYYGQFTWFSFLHHEKLPSAIDRYMAEIKRILGVVESSLVGREWLVGNKMTFADLSFVAWNDALWAVPGLIDVNEFPAVKAWHDRMTSRPAFKQVQALRQKFEKEGAAMLESLKRTEA